MIIEKLEACPICGETKRWNYDGQMCDACPQEQGIEAMDRRITVHAARDGTWLNFHPSSAKGASIRMETLADQHPRGSIIRNAILDWCADMQDSAVKKVNSENRPK